MLEELFQQPTMPKQQNHYILSKVILLHDQAAPHTFAAPVELGMIFCPAPRPPRQSFIEGPSTVFCVAEHQRESKQTHLSKQ